MKLHKRFYDIAFVLIAGLIVFTIATKPLFNWDMLGYMGVVIEYSDKDIEHIHESVYSALQSYVPPDSINALATGSVQRLERYTDANAFYDNLSYYRTKPLYNWLVFVLYSSGASLVWSTIYPSVVFSFLLLLVFYMWLSEYIAKPLAVLVALLVSLLPGYLELVRLSTPDAMSCFSILLSLYFVYLKKNIWWIGVCLLLSILTRIDNIIFASVLLTFLYYSDLSRQWRNIVGLVLVAILSLILIPVLSGNTFNWFLRFTFLTSTDTLLYHLRRVGESFLTTGYILFTINTIILLFANSRQYNFFLNISVITVLLHLVLFPSLQERFFFAYELVVILTNVYVLAKFVNLKVSINTSTNIS